MGALEAFRTSPTTTGPIEVGRVLTDTTEIRRSELWMVFSTAAPREHEAATSVPTRRRASRMRVCMFVCYRPFLVRGLPAVTHSPHRCGDFFGVQDIGHEAHLVVPGSGRYQGPDLFFQNVVHIETQLGLCQWTGIGRVPDDHGLRRDLSTFRIRGSEQHEQLVLPV